MDSENNMNQVSLKAKLDKRDSIIRNKKVQNVRIYDTAQKEKKKQNYDEETASLVDENTSAKATNIIYLKHTRKS